MDPALFAQRLMDASVRARDFARTYFEETLPDELHFQVRLNASYDGNPLHADEVTYPEDAGRTVAECTAEEAIALLWRSSRVPEWINVSVVGVDPKGTRIELLSCGRFTANDTLLYHQQEGRAPFHVLGPTLPVGWREGERFSIYHRASCDTPEAVERLAPHARKVWSLDLSGRRLDDGVLAHLPILPNLELLDLNGLSLEGPGLVDLARQPKLRVVQAVLDPAVTFRIPRLRRLPGVEIVTLTGVPSVEWGFGELVAAAPALTDVWLSSAGKLLLGAGLPRALGRLSLTGTLTDARPRGEIDSLFLCLTAASEADVERVLEGIERLKSLELRGTPVGDELVARVFERWRLDYLGLVDTRVSEGLVRRLSAERPKMRIMPRLTS